MLNGSLAAVNRRGHLDVVTTVARHKRQITSNAPESRTNRESHAKKEKTRARVFGNPRRSYEPNREEREPDDGVNPGERELRRRANLGDGRLLVKQVGHAAKGCG